MEDRVPFAPPAAELRVDLQEIPHVMTSPTRLQYRVQTIFDRVASPPGAVQTAFLPCKTGPLFVVDSVSHILGIERIAIICHYEPRPLRKRHRQVTHVTGMIDLHGHGLVIDGLAADRTKEVRQGRLDAELGFIVPEHLQDQPWVPMYLRLVRNVKVSHLPWPLQIRQHHLLTFAHLELVILHVIVRDAVSNAINIRQ